MVCRLLLIKMLHLRNHAAGQWFRILLIIMYQFARDAPDIRLAGFPAG
jgi:hypothetical protein